MAGLRVVLDTNVLVSGIVYPGSIPGRIVALSMQGGLDVALSHYILDEMTRVLPRCARFKMDAVEVRDWVDSLMFLADMVEPDGKQEARLRDDADQLILATFRAAGADYLITGDKDLLALGDQYPILTPASFWERHG